MYLLFLFAGTSLCPYLFLCFGVISLCCTYVLLSSFSSQSVLPIWLSHFFPILLFLFTPLNLYVRAWLFSFLIFFLLFSSASQLNKPLNIDRLLLTSSLFLPNWYLLYEGVFRFSAAIPLVLSTTAVIELGGELRKESVCISLSTLSTRESSTSADNCTDDNSKNRDDNTDVLAAGCLQ